jgi:hypothetical protein
MMGSCALPDLALTTQSSALSRRKQPESDQEVAQQGSGIDFRTRGRTASDTRDRKPVDRPRTVVIFYGQHRPLDLSDGSSPEV